MNIITVIVHYNNEEECSDFVNDFVSKVEEHPIIIVDNKSENESLKTLKDLIVSKNVEILENRNNNGFGAGINHGVNYGQKYNPEFIHIVNTDVRLINPSYIEQLVSVLNANDSISLVGPTVYVNEHKEVQNTILPFPSLKSSVLFKNIANQSFESEKIEVKEVEAINGVCFIVRNRHFNEVNGFTESYFMYGEEQDLSYKLFRKGYKSAFVSALSILHFGGNVKQDDVIDWKFIAVRVNQVRFISMYRNKFEAIIISIIMIASILLKQIKGTKYKSQNLKTVIRSFIYVIFKPLNVNHSSKI